MIRWATPEDAEALSELLQRIFKKYPQAGGKPDDWTLERTKVILEHRPAIMLNEEKGAILSAVYAAITESIEGKTAQIIFGIADLDLPQKPSDKLSTHSLVLDGAAKPMAEWLISQGVTIAYTYQEKNTAGQQYMEELGCNFDALSTDRVSCEFDLSAFVTAIDNRKKR